jgi:acetoin utilization deacetylase AcuC-like enzyme
VKTGLITTKSYQNHNTGNGHPEKIDRVTAVIDNFKKKNNNNLIWQEPKKFDQSLLIKTHSKEYIEFVNNSFPKDGLSFLDGDTIVSPGSKDATRDAAGSIITAIDGVESKEYKMLFVLLDLLVTMLKKIRQWGFVFITMLLLVLTI